MTRLQLGLNIGSPQNPINDIVCLGMTGLPAFTVYAREAMMGQEIHLRTTHTGMAADEGSTQSKARANSQLPIRQGETKVANWQSVQPIACIGGRDSTQRGLGGRSEERR